MIKNSLSRPITLIALLCIAANSSAKADDDLTVLGKDANRLLYTSLLKQSAAIYQLRAQEVSKALLSPEAAKQRSTRLRQDYLQAIGDLPEEKCPLNAQITNTTNMGGYRIENVVFESRPKHRVTANVYVPTKGAGPFPGILIPCGHSPNGKIGYFPVGALFAQHGFVAIIYDPICQGERHQPGNLEGTVGHSRILPGNILVGRTVVGTEAWDGMRAIDYLLTRDDVDKAKAIGMTGNSGGGCRTNFLMALDDRIGPAAPSCYVMRQHRKFEILGPGDGCQWIPNAVKFGIDHADMAWMHAPRPTLILAAEKDYVEFKSTQEVAAEMKQLYSAIGVPDQANLFSFNDRHGFSKPRREAAVRWMKRWLKDDHTPVVEGPIRRPLLAEALLVTKSGQVLSEYKDEQSTMQLNLQRAAELAGQRKLFWQQDKSNALAAIKGRIGSTKTSDSQATVESKGIILREDYQIEKLIIRGPDQLPIPALLFSPKNQKQTKTAHLYLSDQGKSSDDALQEIEKLTLTGSTVLSIDLRGFGETSDRMSKRKQLGREYGVATVSLQLGKSILGQRVDDILSAADILLKRSGAKDITLIGSGQAAPVALHAIALDLRFATVTLENSIKSWTDVIEGKPGYNAMIFGALKIYDLPDLVKSVEPRTVTWTERKRLRVKKK